MWQASHFLDPVCYTAQSQICLKIQVQKLIARLPFIGMLMKLATAATSKKRHQHASLYVRLSNRQKGCIDLLPCKPKDAGRFGFQYIK